MPKKKKRQKVPDDEHAHLAIRVDGYEAKIGATINHNVFAPQFAWNLEDDDPLFEFVTQLVISGTITYPEERSGASFEITFLASNTGSKDFQSTLKDVQARDEHGVPEYRIYRGRQIPIYKPPKGMGLVDKIRGEASWVAHLRVSPSFVSNALALLTTGRRLFLAVNERKSDQTRWIQSANLQTTNPAEE